MAKRTKLSHKLTPQTALERHVAKWINDKAQGYDGNVADVLKDLMQGGCSSGCVGHLVYTCDKVAFYRRHRTEIGHMVAAVCLDTGEAFAPREWDKADPLACTAENQNILAWVGFETAAQNLADRAGIEL